MKSEIKLGFQDYTALVFIPDPASTDGSGKTGLVAANLTVSYVRVETDNDVTVTDVTSSLNNLGALTTAHTDWGLLEVSSTLAPGLYRLDIADAVFAAGAWTAVVYVMITTSAAAASPMEFILVAFDPLDTVRLGLTALPNAAADGVGGLPISDAGGLDLDSKLANTNEVTAARMGALTDWINGGRLDLILDDILLDTGTTLDDLIDDLESRLTATRAGYLDNLSAGAVATQASVNTIDDFLDTEIGAIITTLGTPAGASVSADILVIDNFVDAEITDIQNRLPAALVSGRMDSSVGAMAAGVVTATAVATDAIDSDALAANAITEIQNGLATAAALTIVAGFVDTEIATLQSDVSAILADTGTDGVAVAAASKTGYALSAAGIDEIFDELRAGHSVAGSYGESFFTLESGAAIAGTLSATQMSTNLTEATDDHYTGRIVIFTTGALLRQATDITAYNGTTKVLTFTALTEAPAAADKFIIV